MGKTWSMYWIILLFVSFIILLMNLFFSKEYILFSPISGYIYVDKKPVSNATITRWYKWWFYNREWSEGTTTDENGFFTFSKAITEKSIILWIIPHEAVITQKLFTQYKDKDILIYSTVKRNYELNWEYWGRQLEFIFDPSKKNIQHKTFTPIPDLPDFTESIGILSWEQ